MVREETLQVAKEAPNIDFIVSRLRDALSPYTREVKFAFLFGSHARGEADIWSDIDVGIYIAGGVDDEARNRVRFAVADSLYPFEVEAAYLDGEDMPPEIFLAATDGVLVVLNDEDALFAARMRHIHRREEMRPLDSNKKINSIEAFIRQETDIFLGMLKDASQDTYTADNMLRRAVDKSLNDIILACVDLAAQLLRVKKRVIPKTYKEIILATHEFIGAPALRIAPLTACRNETIPQYMKLNWENVKTIKAAKDDILLFTSKVVSAAAQGSVDAT